MAPHPQMALLHTLNKTQIPPTRPFGGWPLPLSLTLPARLPLDQRLKPHRPFCSSSQLAYPHLRALLLCLKHSAPGHFQSSRPSGLCSTLASSRRPSLAALYRLEVPSSPSSLFPSLLYFSSEHVSPPDTASLSLLTGLLSVCPARMEAACGQETGLFYLEPGPALGKCLSHE